MSMNISRFVGAVVGVLIVRVALNWSFYAKVMGRQYAQISSAHPGMLRTVIPAYIVTDLILALAFAFLFAKVGAALGGGVKGGVILGVIIAILSPVIGTLYALRVLRRHLSAWESGSRERHLPSDCACYRG